VTISVFILSGPSLKATVSLDGPIAPPEVDSGLDLHNAAEDYPNKPKGADTHLTFSSVVDFEHLNIPLDVEEDDDDDVHDEVKKIDPNDPEAVELRRKQREKSREIFLAAKEKRDQKKLLQVRKIREDGEPFQYTAKAPSAGWYRTCVQGTWYQVSHFSR
jgi:hypothetical protein